jgi:acyl carrier protein
MTMTKAETKVLIREILGDIASEADLATLTADEDLREALDLDSMDFMNLIVALHERTVIDTSEADYAKLRTLGGATPISGRTSGNSSRAARGNRRERISSATSNVSKRRLYRNLF